MVLGKLDSYVQKNETKPLSYATHKSNQEWIKVLSERPETVKLLVENISVLSPQYRSCGWFFLFYLNPKAKATKAKMNTCDYIKLNENKNKKAAQ